MAVTLESVICGIFRDDASTSSRGGCLRGASNAPITPILFMDIPINQEVVEIPMFAFDAFLNAHQRTSSSSMLVAQLYSTGTSSSYKSLDAIMKECLSTMFSKHLIKVSIPNAVDTYYCTFGAVFNSSLKPLMMMSWLLEKKADDDGSVKYQYKRPILRIDPGVCVSKEDALQRFIANKILVSSLNVSIRAPYTYNVDSFLWQDRPLHIRNWHVKAEIDECPLVIRRPDVPSAYVTNQDLLQLAADHIDELLQE